MYETISTDLKGGKLTLALNRPERMKTYTDKMNEELLNLRLKCSGCRDFSIQ